LDFPIALSAHSKVPPSKQLVLELRHSIRQGRLSPGQHLPSSRELADLLSLSRSTVVKAYKRLLAEGMLETQVGSGTYVKRGLTLANPSLNQLPQASKMPPQASFDPLALASEIPPEPTFRAPSMAHLSNLSRAILDVEIVQGSAVDTPELNFGCSPADLLPNRQWRELFARHCRSLHTPQRAADNEIFGYRPLREALAEFLRRTKAVNCRADQIIVFSGSQNILSFVASFLVNENDLVVVENPGYAGTRNNLEARGVRVQAVDTDENGLRVDDLDEIEEPCKLACVSLSHQDPTGAILSMERRKKLISWAKRKNAYIVEDAWDSDYHYGHPALPALQGMDKDARVLYIYSFWKLLFPIVTTGILVVPEHLIELFTRAKIMLERPFAPIEHFALAEFIAEGHLECHISKSRAIYEGRRQAVIFNLTKNFQTAVEIPKYSAGLHQLIRFRVDLSEAQILQCANQARLPMVSTASYYVREGLPLEFLIPFGILDKGSIGKKILDLAENMKAMTTVTAMTGMTENAFAP
jgi:GntR family transcriptional regulator / MocR family aminotransferase